MLATVLGISAERDEFGDESVYVRPVVKWLMRQGQRISTPPAVCRQLWRPGRPWRGRQYRPGVSSIRRARFSWSRCGGLVDVVCEPEAYVRSFDVLTSHARIYPDNAVVVISRLASRASTFSRSASTVTCCPAYLMRTMQPSSSPNTATSPPIKMKLIPSASGYDSEKRTTYTSAVAVPRRRCHAPAWLCSRATRLANVVYLHSAASASASRTASTSRRRTTSAAPHEPTGRSVFRGASTKTSLAGRHADME